LVKHGDNFTFYFTLRSDYQFEENELSRECIMLRKDEKCKQNIGRKNLREETTLKTKMWIEGPYAVGYQRNKVALVWLINWTDG
jgi:hypothetical protein